MEASYLSAITMVHKDHMIVSNSSGKTVLQYQILLYTVDSRQQKM